MAVEEGGLVRVYCFQNNWVSWCQKGKTSLDVNEARVDGVWEWQLYQLDHMQTISTDR